jgi:ribosome-binding protein aMBF1 (putative translation factor)
MVMRTTKRVVTLKVVKVAGAYLTHCVACRAIFGNRMSENLMDRYASAHFQSADTDRVRGLGACAWP